MFLLFTKDKECRLKENIGLRGSVTKNTIHSALSLQNGSVRRKYEIKYFITYLQHQCLPSLFPYQPAISPLSLSVSSKCIVADRAKCIILKKRIFFCARVHFFSFINRIQVTALGEKKICYEKLTYACL